MRALLVAAVAVLAVASTSLAEGFCGRICILPPDGGMVCKFVDAGCPRDAGSVRRVIDPGDGGEPRVVDLGPWDPRPAPSEWGYSYSEAPPPYGSYPTEQHSEPTP